MGGAVLPSIYLGQTMLEVMKIMVTSLKRSQACTAPLSVPSPAAGLRQPTPLPETPRPPQASPGQSPVGSLLPSPGSWCTRFCCALREYISQSCVSSDSSRVGLIVTSSKRAYTYPKSAAPRAPVPAADHRQPIPVQETLKHSSVSVSMGFMGPGA